MRKKGTSDNMVKCNTEICDGITICAKCGEDGVTDFIEQKRGVRQGCSSKSYLFTSKNA
jgi:hypothetical protein